MLDTESFLLGIAAGGGGDGGNPNYVETIEGTLANPWGGYTLQQILDGIASNQMSIMIFSEGQSVAPAVFQQMNALLFSLAFVLGDNQSFTALSLMYAGTDVTAFTMHGQNGNYTITAEDLTTPCTLTIIHHPLP